MKILFYRYGSICEPDLIEQFEKVGLEVVTVDPEITNKGLSSSERIDLLANILTKDSFLFVFSINFFPSISDLCEILKLPYVGWVVDAPVLELFTKSIQNKCNKIFCFDYKQYTQIAPYNPEGVFHLPLGTNVTRWDKVVSSISAADRKKFTSDISFVGSLYTEKDPYLDIKNPSEFLKGFVDGLYNCQKNVQGVNVIEPALSDGVIAELKEKLPKYFVAKDACVQDMDRFIASHYILDTHCSSLERVEFLNSLAGNFGLSLYTRSPLPTDATNLKSKGGVSTLTEMPKVFNLSKINLNMTIHSIETGASLRIWDIMGCGGFLLTNYQPELENYLVAGEDYDYYTSLEDLTEKCDYYLKHDDVRKAIALNGYEKVKTLHCYGNRFPVIFNEVMKLFE